MDSFSLTVLRAGWAVYDFLNRPLWHQPKVGKDLLLLGLQIAGLDASAGGEAMQDSVLGRTAPGALNDKPPVLGSSFHFFLSDTS